MAKPRVRIDWPSGVSFAADVTSNILGEIECWRGRSYNNPQYRQQGVGVAGHCTFILRNDGDRYTITDDDNIPTGARVRVDLQVSATEWRTIWTGYIDTYDYSYRRQGYDRIIVRALGRMAQLETGTWSIAQATPDPRAYDVINSIVEGVTGEGVEDSPDYNRSGNRNLEPPGGAAAEGSRDWSVRMQNFRIEEAPALQTIRDAATISFAHVYETASGRLRIDGLPARQSKVDGSSELTFRDTSGTGVRVHDYEVGLKNERIANAAAKSVLQRFDPVEIDYSPNTIASGTGTKTTTGAGRRQNVTLGLVGHTYASRISAVSSPRYTMYSYPGPVDFIFHVSGHNPDSVYPYPARLRFTARVQPDAYVFNDPDGVLAPVLTTPDPFTLTITTPSNYNRTRAQTEHTGETDRDGSGIYARYSQYPPWTSSDDTRLTIRNRDSRSHPPEGATPEYYELYRQQYFYGGYTLPLELHVTVITFSLVRPVDAPSEYNWSWQLEYQPPVLSTSTNFIAQNDDSITSYGRRGYAIPGIFWGPDVSTGEPDSLDVRSFIGYIVRDEFLGAPGYYGTIVVDLTRQYYPTDGATNPELDVGDKITLWQGTTSRDFLVSAIRYRFRQGEQLRAQIECAPARVM